MLRCDKASPLNFVCLKGEWFIIEHTIESEEKNVRPKSTFSMRTITEYFRGRGVLFNRRKDLLLQSLMMSHLVGD
jgi:hypothetical protein